MNERLAYEIGWDFSSVNLPLPGHGANIRALHEGFVQGTFHFGSKTMPSDEFTRKWLNLRISALERRRHFDESVTPAYLRQIYRTHCPIIGAELTYGRMDGTDWSIDRLDSNGGYARGNLCIMSARANVAKGNLPICEIVNRAWASRPIDGLEPIAWERLYGLTAGVLEFIGGYIMKPLTRIPGRPHRDQLLTGLHAAQLLVSERIAVPTSREFAELERTVPRIAITEWKAFRALAALRVKSVDDTLSIWDERDCLQALDAVARAAGDAWLLELKRIEADGRPECPKRAEAAQMRARFALKNRGYAVEVVPGD